MLGELIKYENRGKNQLNKNVYKTRHDFERQILKPRLTCLDDLISQTSVHSNIYTGIIVNNIDNRISMVVHNNDLI